VETSTSHNPYGPLRAVTGIALPFFLNSNVDLHDTDVKYGNRIVRKLGNSLRTQSSSLRLLKNCRLFVENCKFKVNYLRNYKKARRPFVFVRTAEREKRQYTRANPLSSSEQESVYRACPSLGPVSKCQKPPQSRAVYDLAKFDPSGCNCVEMYDQPNPPPPQTHTHLFVDIRDS
jgi:hypothetical protein